MSDAAFNLSLTACARSWAATHPGGRPYNEDTFVERPEIGLWAVADGAGGHQSGDVASATIAAALTDIPTGLNAAELLAQVRLRIAAANLELRAMAATRGPDAVLATTVVVLIARGGHYACLWAGDSRAYLLRDGVLTQISHDHSLVQEMVDAGMLAAEHAEKHPRANVITRAVGAAADLTLDKETSRSQPGDRFLLCSDGLCKTLAPDEIGRLLAAEDDVAAQLVAAAVAARSSDNVTAVVVAL